MTDIDIPEDTRRSRLPKPHAQVIDEEFVTADERFAAFRQLHPNGYVGSKLFDTIKHPDGNVTYVVIGFAYKERPAGLPVLEGADASAMAQGSTASENTVVAGSPLESADTIARSRALRFLGILTGTKTAPATLGAPQTDEQIGADVTTARERSEMSQPDLATAMTERGFKWSQATVSQIEKGTRPLRHNEAQHLAELIRYGRAK